MIDFSIVTAVLSAINLLVLGLLAIRFHKVKQGLSHIQVAYFSEINESNGFMKKQKIVKIKAQFFLGEIPIGHPFLVSEQTTEEVHQERIDALINNVAQPLANLGIKVALKSVA